MNALRGAYRDVEVLRVHCLDSLGRQTRFSNDL